jgi:hypothetical protein
MYQLLPSAHRARDAELGYPLRSLLEPVETELLRLREDIDGLYDNWFVETCAEWVLPYLGDLLGVEALSTSPDGAASRRAFVANTLRHRRRTGTPGALEQVARDLTGWPARVVEYFQLLGTTQHLNHVRPGNLRTPDLRDTGRLARLGTPFDQVARSADVRHIDRGRGRHTIDAVGLHLWRLGAYPCTGLDARAVDAAAGRWTFDPAGRDLPLFTRPRGAAAPDEPLTETDVPAPPRRLALHLELERVRGTDRTPRLLADPDPLFRIALPGDGRPVGAARLLCADLTEWTRPPSASDGPWVAVDPLLGRLTLPAGVEPERVRVDFAYGFPGDTGAGPHDRRGTLAAALSAAGTPWPDSVDWQIGVSRDHATPGGRVVATMGEAVRAWNARPEPRPGQVGVIVVMDSATYHEELTGENRIEIPPGNRLLMVAARWPSGLAQRPPDVPAQGPGPFAAAGLRPHLVGSLEAAASGGRAAVPAELVLDGLSVEGHVTVAPGDLDSLVVSSCTLAADRAGSLADGGLLRAQDNPRLTVRLIRTVCAGLRLGGRLPGLSLADSVVHAGGDTQAPAVDAGPADVELEACTVLGRTEARTLTASDTILRGRAEALQRQQGYLRFSYAPLDSNVARRYNCHPADAAEAARVAPVFTSVRPADPGFCQLAAGCPDEIVTGAEDAGEMGAFHFVQQRRRIADLATQLDRYLRFGLEAGVLFTN